MTRKEKVVEFRVFSNPEKEIGHFIEHPEDIPKGKDRIVYVDSVKRLKTLLSTSNLELLQALEGDKGLTVGKLAKRMKRKRRAVIQGLRALFDVGLVQLTKKGRNVYPKKAVDKIVIAV